MTDNEAFEKMWAIKGHAQAVMESITLNGVNDNKFIMIVDTINRMRALASDCLQYRNNK